MNTMKIATAVLLLLFTILFFVILSVEKAYPQTGAAGREENQYQDAAGKQREIPAGEPDRLKLALSDPGYPVTAGDTYILTYISNMGAMTHLNKH